MREQSEDVRDTWGPFAATVSRHSGVQWPLATDALSYKTTGRSSLESMVQPSRAWLRLRAMFGLGARTEILRYFLSGHRRATVATIAQHIRYAKRNVAEECDSLEKAGVLRVHHVANRFYYMLDRTEELRNWVGDIAPVKIDWTSLFAVTSALVALEKSAERLSHDALAVEAHRVARVIDEHLDVLDIEERPSLIRPDTYWPAVRDFADRYLSAWASGHWHPDDNAARLRTRRVAPQSPSAGA